MTKKVVFVSDFFIEQGITGGAEFYNDNLINLLSSEYEFIKIQCTNLSPELINEYRDDFFIVANFMTLSEHNKSLLRQNVDYAILEHDHKYAANNNPAFFDNFLIPEHMVINKDFFAGARAILCQSKLHSEIVQKNLLLSHVCNLGGNLWTNEQIDILKKNMSNEKTIRYGIMESENKNKGMHFSIEYCRKNNLEFSLLKSKEYHRFIEELSIVENLIFFPQWVESYSRVAVEAKIVGCKLITNGMLGVASEEYFKLKPTQLVEVLYKNNEKILNTFRSVIEDSSEISYLPAINLPKISILGTMYKGSKFIKNFLDNIVSLSNFENCELILVDANSPDGEYEIIEEYLKKYSNIVYHRTNERVSIPEALNIGIEKSTGEFLTFGLIDDVRDSDSLVALSKHLFFDTSVDLVYGQCLQTKNPNETMQNHTSSGELYEHSKMPFSPQNMIKCLPGPMPLWRKSLHDKYGGFDKNHIYSNDWEMWLRAVNRGSQFKRVEAIVGLYLEGGLSQSDTLNIDQRSEEASLFFKYSHLFGQKNVNIYTPYFQQFSGEKNEQQSK